MKAEGIGSPGWASKTPKEPRPGVENAPYPSPYPNSLKRLLKKPPHPPDVLLKYLDTQFPSLYIQLTPNRVLIKFSMGACHEIVVSMGMQSGMVPCYLDIPCPLTQLYDATETPRCVAQLQ